MKTLAVMVKGSTQPFIAQMDENVVADFKKERDVDGIMTFIELGGNLAYIPAHNIQFISVVDIQDEVVKREVIKGQLSST